ncbi:MAG: (Fe-S)-binding protein [Deltaproteobacteria bacterium]|nr:MAG: (Fe-S)-binding protein [Deltaproteobacteria bacterium]
MRQAEIIDQLERCSRCGSCMSVCPTYRETGEEGMVARGKLTLIEAFQGEELPLSRKFRKLVETCLLCGACARHCANGVRPDNLIQWQRSQLRERGPTSWTARLATNTLEAAGQWPRLMGPAASLAQALICKKIPAESGLHLRFPLAVLSQRRYVPRLSHSPFLTKVSDRALGHGPKVGLFVGCVGNYLFPQISEAILELLGRCGYQVIVPGDQRCCGMPAWASGDVETATALAEHNSRVFLESGCQWVVSGCGTCSTQLRTRIPELLGGAAPGAARFFLQQSVDLVAFIVGQLSPVVLRRALKSPGKVTVGYHDPCHLLHHQSIFEEPRRLLSLLPGVSVADPSDTHQCCGHGGLFNIRNYRLSSQIGLRSISRFDKSGSDVLATACMGCLMQLQESNWRHNAGLTVCHLVEVVTGRVAT